LNLLLNTCAVLWWFDDDPRLGAAAAAITDRGDSVFVRIASWWAVARKTRLGKMSVPLPRLSGAIAPLLADAGC